MTIREYAKSVGFEIVGKLTRLGANVRKVCCSDEIELREAQ